MKKILVCIANYGDEHYPFLLKILAEYNSMITFEVEVVILCTTKCNLPEFKNLKVRKEFYNHNIGENLLAKHKKILAENINNYDLFVFMENDFLIKESNLNEFLIFSKILKKTNFIPGFLVYEKKENDDYQYLIGLHPAHNIWRWGNGIGMKFLFIVNFFIPNKRIVEKKITFKNKTYFLPSNIHQGFYVLTKMQFKKILSSGKYFSDYDTNSFGGLMESASSDVYFKCGMVKLCSLDKINSFLVHHLPDKYVNHKEYNKEIVPNVEKLIDIVNNTKMS